MCCLPDSKDHPFTLDMNLTKQSRLLLKVQSLIFGSDIQSPQSDHRLPGLSHERKGLCTKKRTIFWLKFNLRGKNIRTITSQVAFVSIGSRFQSAINNACGHYCHQYIVFRCSDGKSQSYCVLCTN